MEGLLFPGFKGRLQDVIGPNQEKVRHITSRKTTDCPSYTSFYVWLIMSGRQILFPYDKLTDVASLNGQTC